MPTLHARPVYGRATAAALDAAEAEIGFALPVLLRRLYAEVENGGFGPGAGLVGVDGGHTDMVGRSLGAAYDVLRSRGWPRGLLPLCDWGGGAWSCIDVHGPEERIFTMESWPTRTRFTLAAWLEAWGSGGDLWAETFEMEDAIVTNPFTKRPVAVKRRARARGAAL